MKLLLGIIILIQFPYRYSLRIKTRRGVSFFFTENTSWNMINVNLKQYVCQCVSTIFVLLTSV